MTAVPWWLFGRWERDRVEAHRASAREQLEKEREAERHRPDMEGDEYLWERQRHGWRDR